MKVYAIILTVLRSFSNEYLFYFDLGSSGSNHIELNQN